jgi:hypothetical protein
MVGSGIQKQNSGVDLNQDQWHCTFMKEAAEKAKIEYLQLLLP